VVISLFPGRNMGYLADTSRKGCLRCLDGVMHLVRSLKLLSSKRDMNVSPQSTAVTFQP
jgi:hypothetical protein